MAENGVAFKVFVRQGDDDKPEVRRFTIDRSVVTNFEYLRAKLQSVFPTLKSVPFSVSWQDDEGDEVTISSDEELLVALASIQDDLKKLYVDFNDSSMNEEPVEVMEIPEFPQDNPQREHIGIVCDGCNGPIVGYRYKCVTCDDFDLCPTCEGGNKHAQHFMIRIPVPIGPMRRRFSRHIGHSLFKSMRRGGAVEAGIGAGECPMLKRHCKDRTSEGRRGSRYEGRCGARSDKRQETISEERTHPHEGRRCGRRNAGGWLNTVATYMNEFANLAGDLNLTPNVTPAAANATNPATNTATEAGTTTNAGASASAGNATASTPANEYEKMQEVHRMYLLNVGRTVAKILDPLGIDVDIEVRPKSAAPEQSATEASTVPAPSAPAPSTPTPSAPAPSTPTPSAPAPPVACPVVSSYPKMTTCIPISNFIQSQQETTTLIDVDDDMSEKNSSRDKSETPERMEGWTILNTEGPEPVQPPNPPTGSAGFDFERMTRDFRQQMQALQAHHLSPEVTNIYPNLPAHTSQPTAPVQEPQASQSAGVATSAPAAPKVVLEPEYRPADPKIAAALDTMLAMGFKNDGGRLARLIEKKNGNISSVLDILSMNIP